MLAIYGKVGLHLASESSKRKEVETKGWGGGKEKQVTLLYPRHGFSPELWAFKLLGLWAPSPLSPGLRNPD